MSNESCLLVAHRDAGTLSVLSKALSKAGYRIIEAQNGLAVLRRPSELQPDAILLSSCLAGTDGFQTATQLKDRLDSWPIPVLLLIDPEDHQTGESQDLYGADAYLKIPCPTGRLIEKVEALLQEKRIRENLQSKMRSRLEEGLSEVLEETSRQLIQEKTQNLVAQLSVGLVDLVEAEAQSEMKRRIASLAEEEGREIVSGWIKELASPLVNEVAEDAVSRQVSAMIEEKADGLIGRFEQEEMPNIARRVVEQTALEQMPKIIEQAIQGSTKQIVEDMKKQLPGLIEELVAQSLPKVAQRKLDPLIENQIDTHLSADLPRRIVNELDSAMDHIVRPALRRQMSKILWFALFLVAISTCVGIALGLFFPKLLG